jgi:hypothetical protein
MGGAEGRVQKEQSVHGKILWVIDFASLNQPHGKWQVEPHAAFAHRTLTAATSAKIGTWVAGSGRNWANAEEDQGLFICMQLHVASDSFSIPYGTFSSGCFWKKIVARAADSVIRRSLRAHVSRKCIRRWANIYPFLYIYWTFLPIWDGERATWTQEAGQQQQQQQW